jgi:HEPN domain-containing protein
MLKFYAAPFMATMNDLGRAIRALDEALGIGDPPHIRVADALRYLARDLPGLPLSPVVMSQFARLQETVGEGKASVEVVRTRLHDFESSLNDDLRQHSYFLIPASERPLLEYPNLFGPTVAARFQAANDDIAAAGRCLAFNEWTAAVFHAMRAAEIALQRLAKRLGIKYADQRQWGRLLKDIDGVLNVMENETKSAQRDRRIAYYSKARVDFAAFNGAWRKYVMHARAHYDRTEAREIFKHVGSLMQQLASNVPR